MVLLSTTQQPATASRVDAQVATPQLDRARDDQPTSLSSTPKSPAPDTVDVASAARRYGFVRIGFGLIWAIDATLKWLPGFRNGFADMISDAAADQPGWLGPWFRFWSNGVAHDPSLFAIATALAETAICLSLIFGVFQRVGFVFGAVFSAMIWAIGEGFGGPYMSGATDIGCAIIYSVVFVALGVAVPRAIRRAAPALDHRLSRSRAVRWATFH